MSTSAGFMDWIWGKQEFVQQAVEQLPDGIYAFDLDSGRWAYLNQAMEAITGLSIEELRALGVEEFHTRVHPDDQECYLTGIRRLREQGEAETLEFRWLHKDGRYHWLSSTRTVLPAGEAHVCILVGTLRDVTEQKEMEAASRESAERYRTLFEAIGESFTLFEVVRDAEGQPSDLRFLEANPVAVQIVGRSREEVVGRTLREVFPTVSSEWFDAHMQVALTGKSARFERYGSVTGRYYEAYLFSPKPDQVAALGTDITERRQAEQALRESEKRFHSVLDNSRDVIYRMNLQTGHYEYISPSAKAVVGYTPDELMALNAETTFSMVHPDDVAGMRAALRRSEETGTGDLEYRQRTKGGDYRSISNHVAIVRDSAGRPIYRDGNIRDITESKEAEESLRKSEARLGTILDNLTEGVVLVDRNGVVQSINGAIEGMLVRLLGSEAKIPEASKAVQGWVGRHIVELAEPQPELRYVLVQSDGTPFPIEELPVLAALRTGEALRDVIMGVTLGAGVLVWISVNTRPVRDPEGRIHGAVISFADITESKRAEEALRESETRLRNLNETLEQRVIERTDRLRRLAGELTRTEERERRRLAQLLHDHLQQILVAARLSVNAVRNRTQDEWQAQALRQVDGLLDESIAESRSLTAELSPRALYDAGLAPALNWLACWMEEKHHLHVEVDAENLHKETPEETRLVLFQGARELLFNVVKHAGVDQARVELHRSPEDWIELVVSDQGMGMNPAQIGKQQTKGGFGLLNVRERLESLGGRMQIDSAPGEGTRVTLRVPMRPTEAMEEDTSRTAAVVREAADIAAEELAAKRKEVE